MHIDSWAQKAKQIGYRSRAVFKLEEILKVRAVHGGVYNLQNVYLSQKIFCDITIMTDY